MDVVFYRSLTGIHREPRWGFSRVSVTWHITISFDRIDLCRPHLTRIKIYGTGETVRLVTIIWTADVKHAHDPILASGVVIDIRSSKCDVPCTESIISLLLHRILANLDGLLSRVPATRLGKRSRCEASLSPPDEFKRVN